MTVLNPHTALVSQQRALVPGTKLVDGRDERDVLAFLPEFGSLINFFDQYNQLSGNWRPFMLKDPVFLTASISKFPFAKTHQLYRNTCGMLEKNIGSNSFTEALPAGFNQLFDQVNKIYFAVSEWLGFMQQCSIDYPLKRYVTGQVHDHFSAVFWALRELRTVLSVASVVPGIFPPMYYLPAAFSNTVWTDNKDKETYWQVLGLEETLSSNTYTDFYTAITGAVDKTFVFLHTIVNNAKEAYEYVGKIKSPYPDTTLLRVFAGLLQVERDAMNGIADRHLDFYYRDILKQHQQPALPDAAYVYAALSKNDSSFVLPEGTLLNAGLDAQKNPILFSTQNDTELNTAVFTKASTLSAVADGNNRYALYRNDIVSPGTLVKDKQGKTTSWPAFGGSAYAPAVKVSMGFALASPMLLLREGNRKISLEIKFENTADIVLLEKAAYFLSTQKDWLDITGQVTGITAGDNGLSARIDITLDGSQPAIETFVKNPDGLDSSWPMIKMVYTSSADFSQPPVMKNIKIDVEVNGLQTFQLYNDYGALSTKNPFPLFGPSPMPGNSFIIGNSEIFSKPFSSVTLNLQWDQLPPDFATYYAQYNRYIQWEEEQTVKGWLARIREKIAAWIAGRRQEKKAGNAQTTSTAGSLNPPLFSNTSWKAGFGILSQQQWIPVAMKSFVTPQNVTNPATAQEYSEVDYLFVFDNVLQQAISFTGSGSGISGFSPDPSIQNNPLTYTDTSASGFMKMDLGGTTLGFGSGIYAGVVSYIALKNASVIVNKKSDPFIVPANLPYVPKLKGFTASYTATQEYTFDYGPGDYPVQCYYYTPFAGYEVYDNTKNPSDYSSHIGTSLCSPQKVQNGVPLFAPMYHKGVLFLGTENLSAGATINFYAALNRKYVSDYTSLASPGYYCLGTNGWQSLTVYSDSTNHFSCSGIVKTSLPANPDKNAFMMPAGMYWFSVAVTDDAGAYPTVSLFAPNGFETIRAGTNYLADTEAPQLAAGSITKPQQAIPEIAGIVQPFPSFGGKAAETGSQMNQRVSNRIKTKNRVSARGDYYRLILQEFPEIYYVKTVRGNAAGEVYVLLIRQCLATDPDAFLPMVSTCTESKVTSYLTARCDALVTPGVSGFDFQFVKISVSLKVKPGFAFGAVQQAVNNGLNLYMSPWIQSTQKQLQAEQPVTKSGVIDFIKNIEGVESVTSLALSSFVNNTTTGATTVVPGDGTVIKPLNEKTLLVPYTQHTINEMPG